MCVLVFYSGEYVLQYISTPGWVKYMRSQGGLGDACMDKEVDNEIFAKVYLAPTNYCLVKYANKIHICCNVVIKHKIKLKYRKVEVLEDGIRDQGFKC